MAMEPGLVGVVEVVVGAADTADALGNAGVHVLATPRLVALLELAAIRAVEAHLPAGVGTVGTRIDIRHLAATPVGMRATIRATLREVDGRRLVFAIAGHDEVEAIVEGTHERFQIDPARFLARVAAKAG
jgi:predicted thioesterase